MVPSFASFPLTQGYTDIWMGQVHLIYFLDLFTTQEVKPRKYQIKERKHDAQVLGKVIMNIHIYCDNINHG